MYFILFRCLILPCCVVSLGTVSASCLLDSSSVECCYWIQNIIDDILGHIVKLSIYLCQA